MSLTNKSSTHTSVPDEIIANIADTVWPTAPLLLKDDVIHGLQSLSIHAYLSHTPYKLVFALAVYTILIHE